MYELREKVIQAPIPRENEDEVVDDDDDEDCEVCFFIYFEFFKNGTLKWVL